MSKKISFVSELFVKNKFGLVCKGCGRAIELSIDEDGFIYLPTGMLRFKCPHCEQIYELEYDVIPVNE